MLLSCGSGHLSVIAPKQDLRRASKFLRTYGFAVFTSKDRDLPMDIHFHPPAAINAKSTGIRDYSTTDCTGDLEFSHLTTVDSDFNDGHLTPHSNNLHSPSMDLGRHCESSQFTDMDLSINIHLDPHADFKDSSTTDYSTTDCAGDLEFSNLSDDDLSMEIHFDPTPNGRSTSIGDYPMSDCIADLPSSKFTENQSKHSYIQDLDITGRTNVYKQSFEREVVTLLFYYYSSGNLEAAILHLQLNEPSLHHEMVHELLMQAVSSTTKERENSQVKLLMAFVNHRSKTTKTGCG
ncbi:Uncharacterized protein APZ42_031659 [Daphnia magna]|uniref:Uncharacterized protein n=1 Tax=Daphnia magna TaxID=35525 RepID=A0A164MNR7_9CRUS|nr:Uncharacterized protein APZ42_031659 [Daphnia magna]